MNVGRSLVALLLLAAPAGLAVAFPQAPPAKEKGRSLAETAPRPAPAEPIYIPNSRITPIEAQEWYGKIRSFLRKHDWLPKDER